MARYRDSVCRLCRRENIKLFLKGERCFTEKCAISRRNYAPGQHGQRRPTLSDYGVQLREKQKVRRVYGVLEQQFRNYFKIASKSKGITGENLLQFLERRLDNIVYRMGFAESRSQARQLVRHGHLTINGRKVDIPSYLIRVGEVVEVHEKSKNLEMIKAALERVDEKGKPEWLEVDKERLRGSIVRLPNRQDLLSMPIPIQEQLIVEYYSK
ncbi:MAG: 30S ribosomal protein S4 [Candidatus Tectomicrobia bacterium]|nr:30S ribosomal protein S4 [Candidatus Tectomicrobia bacterium]